MEKTWVRERATLWTKHGEKREEGKLAKKNESVVSRN